MLTTLSGKTLMSTQLKHNMQRVGLMGIASGMYYVQIFSPQKEQAYSEKLVIIDE